MRAIPLALAIIAALLGAHAASAQDLSRAKPEDLGFSSERLERITKIFREDAAHGKAPGFVLLIARHGKLGYFEAIGALNPETNAPMTGDAIFRIYSMTKPITQVAAMLLYEEGRITLDEPIAKYLPQFKDIKVGIEKADPAGGQPTLDLVPAQRPILIHDLMRHTSGLTYGDFGDLLVKKAYNDAGLTKGDFDNAEFADRLAKLPLAFQPGTTWDYGHSTDILGRLIEIVSGKSLYRFEKERLLDPLDMKDTSFYVNDPTKQNRVAEPFKDDRTFGIDAEFNDPRVAGKWEAGGDGMVGTATDYARFLQMLLSGGALDGKRYLGPKTIAYMTPDHLGNVIVPGPYYLPGPGYGFGLGFAVRLDQGVSPRMGNPREYDWGGVGGTYFWVDPREDMFVVFMMQSPRQRLHYYALIRDMIYAALVN
ncbi:MAG: beta-lactamase family protein [Alphaproteobacteria bacterium]|nr:MAG: beta-lactamase family protein [Alphaproteobacteria bacterium]